MAILSRIKVNPQQRFDLEDLVALLSAMRTDAKLWTKSCQSTTNQILKGFAVSGIGSTSATVAMTDAAFLIPQNSNDFSYFVSAPAEPDITVPDSDLTNNTRNFLEISLATEDNTPLTKAFWDPEANGGLGQEFNTIVDTITDLKTSIVVSTAGFSGSPDRLPLAIIDTDVSGNIKLILDRRELFGRLSTPSDLDNEYTWGTKSDPGFNLTMTGVTGTFEAGEQITIGGETATVVSGGTVSIVFNEPTGINFFEGDAVAGVDSGATGTIDTIAEAFSGVDKSLDTQSEINKAIMTEIKQMKNTKFWWQTASASLNGLMQNFDSVLVQEAVDAAWSWSGTELSITDGAGGPADADNLARLKRLGDSADLLLTRQDGTGGSTTIPIADGEVLYINLPALGTSRTYTGIGATDTNFQTADSDSYTSADGNYWLAYRQGSMLYVRGYGEMETGESTPISDPDKETILALIAASSAASNQDRQMKMIEGGTWSVVDNAGTYELTLSQDAYIQVPGLTNERNTISAQTISLPNADSVAYIDIVRTTGVPVVATVNVADVNTITDNDNRVIIARRVSTGVLVGPYCFLLKPGEYLELDGALAEINRLLGQLRITAHESDADKVRLAAADTSLLDGNTLSQAIGEFFLRFDGAVIDFTTGEVFESDGVTPLGIDITPQVIPAGEYFWYGISLIPSSVNATNQQTAQVQINLASASNATQNLAPLPLMTGTIKLGGVQVQNNGGNVEVADIRRLGVGSGSGGSGDGDAFTFLETVKNRRDDSLFDAANVYIAPRDEEAATKIDAASTGEYDLVEKAFNFDSISSTLISADMLDAYYKANPDNLSSVEVLLKYKVGSEDPNPTVQVSRNGGNEYQTVTMEQIDDTSSFRGYIDIEEEAANQVIDQQNSTVGDYEIDPTTAKAYGQEITLAETTIIRELDLDIDKNGTPVGALNLKIVADNAGSPSLDTDDILAEVVSIDIESLSVGINTIQLPQTVLIAGTYHFVIEPDQDYIDGFTTAVTSVEIGFDGSAADLEELNLAGDTWSDSGAGFYYVLRGIELDLRVRITSSIADALLSGFAVLFEKASTALAGDSVTQNIYREGFFAVADNTNQFTLPFLANPDLLKVHLRGSGQVFVNGDFTIQGNIIIFPEDQFNNGGIETFQSLVFDQNRGGAYDNSDKNLALLAANHLGSLDGSIDQSVAGRGRLQRRPNGTMVEVTVSDDNEIEIYEVT